MNRVYFVIQIIFCLLTWGCKQKEFENNLDIECNCFIETANDTYAYPVRPGSEEWKAFETSEQMMAAVQVPYSFLNSISTLGVFESCVENPLCIDLYLSHSPQSFYNTFKTDFNTFKELISRDDAATVLINRYASMCLNCNENNYSSFSGKGGNTEYAFASIELLLAQEDILSKATKQESVELAQLVLKNYENNIRSNQSLFFTSFSVWVASRIMRHYNFSEFLELESGNEQILIFAETGVPLLKINSGYTEKDLFRDIIIKLKLFIKIES